jgi:SAM-dependent methyltransferase
MSEYVLGQSDDAARRLALQDTLFEEPSYWLLKELDLPPSGRVVDLGCGPGGFSRRILRRMKYDGVVVGVDNSAGLLEQAKAALAKEGPGQFEAVHADVTTLGPWLDGADAVVGRAMLHHVPMAEQFLGRLRARLRRGMRVGFIEPDFRSMQAQIAWQVARGRTELEPLLVWGTAINQLYNANRISPCVGATLERTLSLCTLGRTRSAWFQCRSDAAMLENMRWFYAEVRERLDEKGIMPAAEVDRQRQLLAELPTTDLPAVWGIFAVTAQA